MTDDDASVGDPRAVLSDQTFDDATAWREWAGSRRGFLRGLAALGGGTTLAVMGTDWGRAATQDGELTDADVFNFFLGLEQLQVVLYGDLFEAINETDDDDAFSQGFVEEAINDGRGVLSNLRQNLSRLAAQDETHVERLETTVEDLGGTPISTPGFGFDTDNVDQLVSIGAQTESITAGVYAQFVKDIDDPDRSTFALRLYGVEERHASFMRWLNGQQPSPEPFAQQVSMAEAESFLAQFDQ